MRAFIVVFVILISIISCAPKKAASQNCYFEGEWVFLDLSGHVIKNYLGIEFDGGQFFHVTHRGRTLIGQYVQKNDSIIVNGGGKYYSYKVLNYSKDTLLLIDNDSKSLYYNKELDYDSSLYLNRINVTAGGCFENCPEFELQIEENTGYFRPFKNCMVSEDRILEISVTEWQRLDSLFKWSKVGSVDTTETYSLIDDWTLQVEIQYNKNSHVSIRGTNGGMPYRLQPIIRELMVRLRRDKLI